jgi:urocanate hydratase
LPKESGLSEPTAIPVASRPAVSSRASTSVGNARATNWRIFGSGAIADWPLLDAMMLCSSMADLVVIHSGGGGYAGYMTSEGITVIADGTAEGAERLDHALTNDTALGVIRYADAGYEESLDEITAKNIPHVVTA